MSNYTICDGKILVNEGKKKTTYYYRTIVDGQRKKINLGNDRALAIDKLREIETHGQVQPKTVDAVWQSYSTSNLLERAPKTQRDYTSRYKMIKKIFGNMRMEEIKPWHIVDYIDKRKKFLMDKAKGNQKIKAGVSANREVAILSILFTYAINRMKLKIDNPCFNIERVKEYGRNKYIEKWEYEKIYEAGDNTLRNVLDLLLFTGQRIADILNMKITDIRKDINLSDIHMPNGLLASEMVGSEYGDLIRLRTNKTGARIDLIIEGELKTIIDRILKQRSTAKIESIYLLADEEGQQLDYWQINKKWMKARDLTGYKQHDIQLRDLRRKNASDDTVENAQIRLGHRNRAMTEKYRDNVIGKAARPLSRLK